MMMMIMTAFPTAKTSMTMGMEFQMIKKVGRGSLIHAFDLGEKIPIEAAAAVGKKSHETVVSPFKLPALGLLLLLLWLLLLLGLSLLLALLAVGVVAER